jgi:hypothetical protein
MTQSVTLDELAVGSGQIAQAETQKRNVSASPNHRPDGSFAPGNQANPGGRPKTRLITDAYKEILAERGADELAKVVYTDATTAKRASDRLAAVQEITDRVEGKPVQSHLVQSPIDAGAARLLADLASRFMPVPVQVNVSVMSANGDTGTPLLVSSESVETDQGNQ